MIGTGGPGEDEYWLAGVLLVDDEPRNTLVARELGIECVAFTPAADMATALRRQGSLPV